MVSRLSEQGGSCHAERHALRYMTKANKTKANTMVVMRLGARDELRCALPCADCAHLMPLLRSRGIRRVYASNQHGNIEEVLPGAGGRPSLSTRTFDTAGTEQSES
mmetsp:Transcript_25249/g.44826  ORF Transcript_25249/g.44826 Transcript_25249/m.44826 type:complete len:106 (-) Transcript_25249:127-444(-)